MISFLQTHLGGLTIHGSFTFRYEGDESLSDEKLAFYRHNLSELQLVIIDEVSLLSANMLYKISNRMCQIFQNKKPFGGRAVAVVGDILQVRYFYIVMFKLLQMILYFALFLYS